MARIRSIKPEFWTAEQVMELSPMARLCFVGMWNFCDDSGIHPVSYKTLKAEVFPSDDITISDIKKYVSEMTEQGLVLEYAIDNRSYWIITGWHHQKIDQPTFKHPLPDGTNPSTTTRRRSNYDLPIHRTDGECSTNVHRTDGECSTNVHRTDGECSPLESKGVEGSRRERIKTTTATRAQEIFENCFDQHEKRIRELYPHADYEAERETCIAHYRSGNPPIDCYPVILKWFQRIKKPLKPVDRQSEFTKIMAANAQACRDFVGAQV